MAIYTASITIYDGWKETLGKAANLGSDTFIMLLTTSDYTPSQSTHTVLGDVTNEVSGSGYARQTLGSVVYTQTGGTAKFDFADPVFTASGGNITARRWVIFDDTLTNDPLVAFGLIDNTNNNVIITDGNTLTFNVNAAGLFTLS